jgi:hypothetical protein
MHQSILLNRIAVSLNIWAMAGFEPRSSIPERISRPLSGKICCVTTNEMATGNFINLTLVLKLLYVLFMLRNSETITDFKGIV